MTANIPNIESEFYHEKNKLLLWFNQWTGKEIPLPHINFDIREMAILLRLIGFELQTCARISQSPPALKFPYPLGMHEIDVEITCSNSESRAVWTKYTGTCTCTCLPGLPSNQTLRLPVLTPAKEKIIKALLSKIYTIIKDGNKFEAKTMEVIKDTTPFSCFHSLDVLEPTNNFLPNWTKQNDSLCEQTDYFNAYFSTQTSSSVPALFDNMSALNSEQISGVSSIDKLVDETFELMTAYEK